MTDDEQIVAIDDPAAGAAAAQTTEDDEPSPEAVARYMEETLREQGYEIYRPGETPRAASSQAPAGDRLDEVGDGDVPAYMVPLLGTALRQQVVANLPPGAPPETAEMIDGLLATMTPTQVQQALAAPGAARLLAESAHSQAMTRVHMAQVRGATPTGVAGVPKGQVAVTVPSEHVEEFNALRAVFPELTVEDFRAAGMVKAR